MNLTLIFLDSGQNVTKNIFFIQIIFSKAIFQSQCMVLYLSGVYKIGLISISERDTPKIQRETCAAVPKNMALFLLDF
jgi:hypothetical protein